MSFQKPAAAETKSTISGYLNVYLPRKSGGRMKVGAIALRNTSEDHAALQAFVEADPENLAKVIAKMQIEFHSTARDDSDNLDL